MTRCASFGTAHDGCVARALCFFMIAILLLCDAAKSEFIVPNLIPESLHKPRKYGSRFGGTNAINVHPQTIATCSEDAFIVGAPKDTSCARGALQVANGDDLRSAIDDDACESSGAAYLYARNRTTQKWEVEVFFKLPSKGPHDSSFGEAIVCDESTIAISAPGVDGCTAENFTTGCNEKGAVLVYRRVLGGGGGGGGEWRVELATVLRPEDVIIFESFYGSSLALHNDVLVVGAPNDWRNTTELESVPLVGTLEYAPIGAVWVYVRDAELNWNATATFYLKPQYHDTSTKFGQSVAVRDNLIAVGVPNEKRCGQGLNPVENDVCSGIVGAVYIFERNTSLPNVWYRRSHLKPSIGTNVDTQYYSFGTVVSMHDNVLAVNAMFDSSCVTGVLSARPVGVNESCTLSGAVYVYDTREFNTNAYVKTPTETGPNPYGAYGYFGSTVTVVKDGLLVSIVSRSCDLFLLEEATQSCEQVGAAFFYEARAAADDGGDGAAYELRYALQAPVLSNELRNARFTMSGDLIVSAVPGDDAGSRGTYAWPYAPAKPESANSGGVLVYRVQREWRERARGAVVRVRSLDEDAPSAPLETAAVERYDYRASLRTILSDNTAGSVNVSVTCTSVTPFQEGSPRVETFAASRKLVLRALAVDGVLNVTVRVALEAPSTEINGYHIRLSGLERHGEGDSAYCLRARLVMPRSLDARARVTHWPIGVGELNDSVTFFGKLLDLQRNNAEQLQLGDVDISDWTHTDAPLRYVELNVFSDCDNAQQRRRRKRQQSTTKTAFGVEVLALGVGSSLSPVAPSTTAVPGADGNGAGDDDDGSSATLVVAIVASVVTLCVAFLVVLALVFARRRLGRARHHQSPSASSAAGTALHSPRDHGTASRRSRSVTAQPHSPRANTARRSRSTSRTGGLVAAGGGKRRSAKYGNAKDLLQAGSAQGGALATDYSAIRVPTPLHDYVDMSDVQRASATSSSIPSASTFLGADASAFAYSNSPVTEDATASVHTYASTANDRNDGVHSYGSLRSAARSDESEYQRLRKNDSHIFTYDGVNIVPPETGRKVTDATSNASEYGELDVNSCERVHAKEKSYAHAPEPDSSQSSENKNE